MANTSSASQEHPLHAAIRGCLGDRPSFHNIKAMALSSLTMLGQDELLAGDGAWLPPEESALERCDGPVENLKDILACVRRRTSSFQCGVNRHTPLRVQVHAESPLEFGYELHQNVRDTYALCRQGILSLQEVCKGSSPFYFYAGAETSRARTRACDRSPTGWQDFKRQHRWPVGQFWKRTPPFARAFKAGLQGRVAYVFNKRGGVHGWEQWHGLSNSWSLSGLSDLLTALRRCYDRVVYFRSGARGVGLSGRQSGDGTSDDYLDMELIRSNFSDVLLLHELINQSSPDYIETLNAAQLVLGASADVTVGVQGGGAVLTSLVSTNLLLLCREGYECDTDVSFWAKANNATIIVGSSEDALTTLSTQGCRASGGGAARIDEMQLHYRIKEKSKAVSDAVRKTVGELFDALMQKQKGSLGQPIPSPTDRRVKPKAFEPMPFKPSRPEPNKGRGQGTTGKASGKASGRGTPAKAKTTGKASGKASGRGTPAKSGGGAPSSKAFPGQTNKTRDDFRRQQLLDRLQKLVQKAEQ